MKKGSSSARRSNFQLPLSKPTAELLDLSRRALKVMPSDKKYENFKRVSLDHNQLQTLQHLEQFQRLEELTLISNKVADWRQLQRIRNPVLLKRLRLKNNPLEREPNYRYQLLQHFPSLKTMDEVVLPEGAAKQFCRLQQVVGASLIDWVAMMVGLDKSLNPPSKHSASHHYWHPEPQRLVEAQKAMIKLVESKDCEAGNTLLEKGRHIEEILQSTWTGVRTPVDPDQQLITTEYSYFYQLMIEITQHSSLFADYLLEQVRLCDESHEDLLTQSNDNSMYAMFLQFKAMSGEEAPTKQQHRLSSLETDINTNRHRPNFPYLSMEGYFVNATLKILLDILKDAINSISRFLQKLQKPNVHVSEQHENDQVNLMEVAQREDTHRTEAELQEQDQGYRSQYLGHNEALYLQEQYRNDHRQEDSLETDRRNIPTALIIALLSVLEHYQLKHAFIRIRKTNRRRYSQLRNFAVFFAIKQTIHKRTAFQQLKLNYEQQNLLEIDYGRIRLLSKVFGAWKLLNQAKAKRLKLLSKIVARKDKVQHTVKHFAFVRWKILNSRTLRYIQSIRQPSADPPYYQRQLSQRQIQSDYARLHRNNTRRLVLPASTSRSHLKSLRR